MSNSEDEQVKLITRFIKQETVSKRGKSSCYPTSIINAAIALGVTHLPEAQQIHDNILDDLAALPEIWRGAVLNIANQDERIAQVVENHLGVRMGIDHPNLGRLFLVPRTFQSIYDDISSGVSTHIIVVAEGIHAYATIGVTQSGLLYIDPLDPYSRTEVAQETFNNFFHADSHGWVTTTPIRPRVRVV